MRNTVLVILVAIVMAITWVLQAQDPSGGL
jgi:hypothetical protein